MKEAKEKNTQTGEQIVFRFPVHSTSEFGDAPNYMDWKLCWSDILAMKGDVKTIDESGFDHGIKALPTMANWKDEKEYRLRDESLHIDKSSMVWVSAHPKHADYEVETRPIEIDGLQELYKVAVELDADTVDFAGNIDDQDMQPLPGYGEYVFLKKNNEIISYDSYANIFDGNKVNVEELLAVNQGPAPGS